MSRERLEEHRRLWSGKPVLAQVYAPWFALLLEACPPRGRVLEIGSGPGFLAEHARRTRPDLTWIASDLAPAPWNALAADAVRLPLRDGCCDAVVGLDVLHHVARPAALLAEAARVLRWPGHLALVEPWITPLGFLVYRFFHHERCRLGVDPWAPFPSDKEAFDGDAAVPWRLVRAASATEWARLGFARPRVRRLNAFAYLLSLGFRRVSLLPPPLAGPLLAADRLLAGLAPSTALRAALLFERTRPSGPPARA